MGSRIGHLVASDLRVERLAGGFAFTEGPVWHPDGYLLFSDIPNNARRKWTEDGGVVDVLSPSNECNGMTLDANLDLIVCEHTTRSVVRARLNPDGTEASREVLASSYDGKELNSPNDAIVAPDGSIYFTDPTYGRMARWNVRNPAEPELDFRGVYRISPTGTLELLVDDFVQPNGLCLSPDRSTLYVNDSEALHVRRFSVGTDGTLSGGEVLLAGVGSPDDLAAGFPDGMECDETGNIWVTGPGGIWVVSPEGEHLGTVPIPEHVGSLTWGGSEWNTLYVTASTSIYRFPTLVRGDVRPMRPAS